MTPRIFAVIVSRTIDPMVGVMVMKERWLRRVRREGMDKR